MKAAALVVVVVMGLALLVEGRHPLPPGTNKATTGSPSPSTEPGMGTPSSPVPTTEPNPNATDYIDNSHVLTVPESKFTVLSIFT